MSHQAGQIAIPSVFFTPFLLQRRVGQGAWPEKWQRCPRPVQATAGKRCRFAFDNERDVS